jgi:putative copper export protein
VDFSIVLEAAPKAAVYAAVMLCVGASVGRGLLQFRVAPLLTSGQGAALNDAFRRLAVTASLLLVVALAIRAWAHTATAFGMAGSVSYQNLYTITVESRWGAGWQLQMAAAVALATVSATVSRWPSGGWLAAGGGAVILCYLMPLLGHAAGEPARVILHGSHILAAGIWVGTLTAMTVASRGPDAADTTSSRHIPRSRREMLRHFSPVALSGSTLLLITGATAAWWYLGALSNLWTTSYGRLLMLKLFLAADAAGCGFVNWQAWRRPVTSTDSLRARRLLVGLEIALAAGVIIVTAVLTETEHP